MDQVVLLFQINTLFILVLLSVCARIYTGYTVSTSVCTWIFASWWNHYLFLGRILGHLSLVARCAIHFLLVTSTEGSQTDLITICSCFALTVPALVSLPWLSVFSFPHCAVDYSSCFSWFCFLCHMTNPEEFWFSLVIHWFFLNPLSYGTFCPLSSLRCPHSTSFLFSIQNFICSPGARRVQGSRWFSHFVHNCLSASVFVEYFPVI